MQEDYTQVVRRLVDEVHPQAEYIRLVQDNLNTHTIKSAHEVLIYAAPTAPISV